MERLIYEGKLPLLKSSEISHSRVGLGFEKLDRAVFDPTKVYERVKQTGVKKIRIQSGWERTERVRGVYDFQWLDEIVEELRSGGMEPWLCLCYGNSLYTDLAKTAFGAVGCPPIQTREETEAWLRYVDAVVRHYQGKITLYEIWNEPDNAFSWRHEEGDYKINVKDPIRNAKEYGIFATETAKVIHAADPSARVAAGSIAHLENMQYLNDILATGLYREIDAITFHIYSSYDGERQQTIETARAVVDLYNPAITLIQGEAGAQTRSDGNGAMKGFAWSKEKQVKYLLRTMICDLWCGVEFSSYFTTVDMVEALRGKVGDVATYSDYGYFGILGIEIGENGIPTGEYREKPSYLALRTLATLMKEDCERIPMAVAREYLPSRRVNGTDCTDNTLKTYAFRLSDGTSALFYWNCTPILTHSYEGTVSFSVYGQPTNNVRILNLADGTLYRLPPEMTEDLGHGGIRFRSLPLTDLPLAILFS